MRKRIKKTAQPARPARSKKRRGRVDAALQEINARHAGALKRLAD